MKKKGFEKRKARSRVLLDLDDFNILRLLSDGKDILGLELDALKKEMNMSHNALLVHIRRLQSLNLAIVFRSEEDYKFKIVGITRNGRNILGELLKASQMLQKGQAKFPVKRKTWYGKEKTEDVIIGPVTDKIK